MKNSTKMVKKFFKLYEKYKFTFKMESIAKHLVLKRSCKSNHRPKNK